MPEAFYRETAGGYESTELTRGPWDPDSQHAGPPSALLGRAIERCPSPVAGAANWQVGRITYEILRPVPIAALTIRVEVERPGRRVELLAASLADEHGEVIRARAWRIATAAVELPAGEPAAPGRDAIPGPEAASEEEFFPTGHAVGYHTAVEYRFVSGSFLEPGPATVWMRMRYPLIAGEQPSPLQRVLIAADSGNGVSATLDWHEFLFINVDLSVYLHRLPAGEWVCLDALTTAQPNGIGLAETALSDRDGALGTALQTLLVAARGPDE